LGYDDPRNNGIAGFLKRLRDAGHQGVITFHPIPQRGMGLATLGGSFYYGIASVLTLGLLFNQPMLQMWGKFPDVRLLDALRQPLRDGDLDATRLTGLPRELATLVTADVHADPVGVAAGLADLLVGNIGSIAELLAAAGHPKSSAELHTARWQVESGLLPMF